MLFVLHHYRNIFEEVEGNPDDCEVVDYPGINNLVKSEGKR